MITEYFPDQTMFKTSKLNNLKFIDLFAGLGGFHKALSELGHQCVFASEISQELRDLYYENWGIKPEGDIITLVQNEIIKIPEHDILCAGFPCQPFSKAGKRLGLNDERGNLFDQIIGILEYRKPKYIILENVPNLSTHDNSRTLDLIKKRLISLGYELNLKTYSPVDFGIPQNRKRVFIVGSLDGLHHFDFNNIDSKKSKEINLNEFINKKYPRSAKIDSKRVNALKVWQKFLNIIPKDQTLTGFPIWAMEFGATYPYDEIPYQLTQKELGKYKGSFGADLKNLSKTEQLKLIPNYSKNNKKFPPWKKYFIEQNRSLYLSHKNKIDKVLPLIVEIPFPTLQKLEWNAGNSKRKIRDFLIQFRPSGIRIRKPISFPTLVTSATQNPVIGWQNRYLTREEALKLQSLEDLKLPTSHYAAYRAIGNAVNATIVSHISKELVPLGVASDEAYFVQKPELENAL